MSLYGSLSRRGPSGFGYGTTAEEATAGVVLDGQNILVTGASSGIGRETVRVLSLRGARVFATARTLEAAQRTAAAMHGDVVPLACELSHPESVQACISTLRAHAPKLDAIVANAGVMALPTLTLQHGYEAHFFTNHIGHFSLVTELLDHLGERGRVVVVSSSMHRRAPRGGIEFDNLDGRRGYNGWTAYAQSKLANLLFAKQLARRFSGSARTANAVHPGVIRTKLQRHMNPLFGAVMGLAAPLGLKSVEEGAATQTFAASSPSLANVSGEYLADCNLAQPRADANDEALAARLWDVSERIKAEVAAG